VDVNGLALADGHAGPDADFEQRELQARLGDALGKLEGRCREMFRLKLLGKGFAEIQKELGAAAINTVYTWDFRCRKQLLELLGKAGSGGQR
jgi:RNA polymerase sigma-70 factor (ECF subfamily)